MRVKNSEKIAVDVLFLGMTLLFTLTAPIYRPDARLFPLILGIPLGILLLMQLLFDFSPRFQKAFSFLQERGLLAQGKEAAPEEKAGEWREILKVILWLVGFVASLRIIGYVFAVPLFILLITRFQGKQKWRTAILSSLSCGIFVYVLFTLVLKMHVNS